jgi:hypothetical protein
MSHDDFAFEPIPGLPGVLPRGETLLWQGRPDTWQLAVQAYGLSWVMGWFAVLILWRGAVGASLAGVPGALAYGIPYLLPAAAAGLLIWLLAFAQARATLYTVTTHRVALRIGAALSVTFNVPYTQVASASLDLRRGGSGSVALALTPGNRISFLVAWPHVRPWHLVTQPALRCIPDAERVARLLAEAAETRLSRPEIAPVVPAAAVAAE